SVTAMSYPLSFLFPWLLVLWLLQVLARRRGGWRSRLGFALAALIVVLLPVRGIPLGRWLAGLNLQPSLPLLGLLSNLICKNSFQVELLRPKNKAAAWIFGSIAG